MAQRLHVVNIRTYMKNNKHSYVCKHAKCIEYLTGFQVTNDHLLTRDLFSNGPKKLFSYLVIISIKHHAMMELCHCYLKSNWSAISCIYRGIPPVPERET